MPRSAMVLLVVVVPGGLLLVSAWLLARLLVEKMRAGQGSQPQRFARAVATLSWREIWGKARGPRPSGSRC